MGVRIDCPTGCPPLTIHGGTLTGASARLRVDRSSQYLSALLLAAPASGKPLALQLEGELVSRPYIEMTCRMVRDFGGRIDAVPGGYAVAASSGYRARGYHIEPDASSASYPFVLAAAGGHRISVPNLDRGTLQGDYGLLDLLEAMGARVEREAGRTVVTGQGRLGGLDASMREISDTVMSLAAIAPLASAPVTIRDIANIRIKETDRLAATITELERLGARVESGPDWLRIHPSPLHGARIHCYHDHRMAMSFAVLGTLQPGVEIEDPACTAKTYPGFWDDLGACYATTPW